MVQAVIWLIVLAIAAVCLALALRCCGVDALSLGGRRLALDARPAALRGERFTRAMGLKALLWGAGILAVTYGASFAYCIIRGDISWAGFLHIWRQWDANNYIQIAEQGYDSIQISGMHSLLVFFPLYPWLVRALGLLIPHTQLCAHIVSGLCYIGAVYMFARLVTEELGWPIARLAVGLLSVYPFAFFFAAPYAESLFLLLSVTSFRLIRRHRWVLAGLVGALAAMTRMQGVLLLFAGCVEYCVSDGPVRRLRARDWSGLWRGLWRKLLPLALTLAGTGVYLLVNWHVTGDAFHFVACQKQIWYQGFAPLPDCLRIIWDTFVSRWGQAQMLLLWGPDIVMFAASLAALLYSLRSLPPVWTAYLLGCTLLNYSLSWPLSCGRYTACTFPLFAAAATALRRRPFAAQLVLCASLLLQAAYLFAHLAGKQVM